MEVKCLLFQPVMWRWHPLMCNTSRWVGSFLCINSYLKTSPPTTEKSSSNDDVSNVNKSLLERNFKNLWAGASNFGVLLLHNLFNLTVVLILYLFLPAVLNFFLQTEEAGLKLRALKMANLFNYRISLLLIFSFLNFHIVFFVSILWNLMALPLVPCPIRSIVSSWNGKVVAFFFQMGELD